MPKLNTQILEKNLVINLTRVGNLKNFIVSEKNEYATKVKLISRENSLLTDIIRNQQYEDDKNQQIEKSTIKIPEKISTPKAVDRKKIIKGAISANLIDSKNITQILGSNLAQAIGLGVGLEVAESILPSDTYENKEPSTSFRPDGSNGRLSDSQLKNVGDGFKLWTPAANSYLKMKEAAKRDGVYFELSDGYRTYQDQVEMKKKYGKDAAQPGTSKHGWGIAIDISSPGSREWIVKNGRKYGWIRPSWASWFYEPWHFEYIGETGTTVQPTKPQLKKDKNGYIIHDRINTGKQISYLPIINVDNTPKAIPIPQKAQEPNSPSINTLASNPFFIVATG
jgi:hypothetical protein